MQAEHVEVGNEIVERQISGKTRNRTGGAVIDDLAVEPPEPLRDLGRNGAVSQQSDPRTGQVPADLVKVGFRPGAAADQPVAHDDPAQTGQHQREREIRHRRRIQTGAACDHDPARGRLGQGNAVGSGPPLMDHSQVGCPIEQVRRHLHGTHDGVLRPIECPRPVLQVVGLGEADAQARPGEAANAALRLWRECLENGDPGHVHLRSRIRSCIMPVSSSVRSVNGVRTGPTAKPRRRTPALIADTAYPVLRSRIAAKG